MRRVYRAIGAFCVCFAVGAALSILFGLESRSWVPAGVTTSTIVAIGAFRARARN